ncbi:IPT/TIG domain-containing protein [Metallibacterium sp.]|uniref:VPS10 domain-containing protein n=2 Tax=Metallibacterium sp. TaxID=2940281 RepID=UPI002601E46E|nr:IPT/TIG domain-containing protein [Metallibacterium sp.]
MKRIPWWAVLAVTSLTAVAATAPGALHRSARDRAVAAWQQRELSAPNGGYDGALYQSALRARARMLAQHRAQTSAFKPTGANPAASPAPGQINWTEIGPGNVGGRINTIWIDPSNAQHLIVGAAGGGLWQSNDGGGSWSAVSEFPGSLAVGAIAQLPNGTLLAGTGDEFNEFQPGSGMLMSTDGGNTWSPVADTAPQSNNNFWSVILSIATNSNGVALASTWGGIARSTDGGNTWTQVWPVGSFNASDDVVFDPNNPNSAVADNENGGVVYSTDAGQTWTAGSGLPGTAGARTALSFDPSVAGSVYALVDNNNDSSPSGEVFHSTDGGKTWTLLAGTGAFVNAVSGTAVGALCDNSFSGSPVECQGGYDNVIDVLPHTSGTAPTIYVGGIDIFSSTDGGSTWTMSGEAYARTNHLHADQHAFAWSTSSNAFYVGNDGGFYRQFTSNWLAQNSGLAVTQFYAVAGHAGTTASSHLGSNGSPITPIVAGAQDNGTQLYTGYVSGAAPQPDSWQQIFGGDGGQTAVDPADGNFLYGEYTNLSLFYSSTGGTAQQYSTEPPDTANQNANFIAPMALVPNGSTAATQMLGGGASLWLGSNIQNANPTWTALNGVTLPVGSSGNYISAIGVDPSSNNNLWVGYDNGQVWHTTNATAATPIWTQSGSGTLPDTSAHSLMVNSFWVQPGQPNTVYVTYAGFLSTDDDVFVSTDGGNTWTGIGAGLPPGPVYSLVTHPAYPQILYVGTLTGVYASLDGGQSWSASSQGPANISVNQLAWFDTSNPSQPVLLAATDGRGAWLGSPAYNPTPTLTSLTPNQLTLGASASLVTLDGNGFVGNSSVTLDGAPLADTYQSATQLQVTIPAATLAVSGTHTLVVSNPIPGGGISAGANLTVAYPPPTVSSLSPAAAAMGGAAFTLTVNGSNFQSVSKVQWNGSALTTSYVSGNTLTASVPAADLASGGYATVSVVTPAPGGGSASASFAVDYPVPILSAISPTSAQGGASSVTITATGSNFVPVSTIDWNGKALSTSYVSATQLSASVPAGDLAAGGSIAVTAATPAPGGGTSSAITFAVSAPPAAPGGGGGLGMFSLLLLACLNLPWLLAQRRRRA